MVPITELGITGPVLDKYWKTFRLIYSSNVQQHKVLVPVRTCCLRCGFFFLAPERQILSENRKQSAFWKSLQMQIVSIFLLVLHYCTLPSHACFPNHFTHKSCLHNMKKVAYVYSVGWRGFRARSPTVCDLLLLIKTLSSVWS